MSYAYMMDAALGIPHVEGMERSPKPDGLRRCGLQWSLFPNEDRHWEAAAQSKDDGIMARKDMDLEEGIRSGYPLYGGGGDVNEART